MHPSTSVVITAVVIGVVVSCTSAAPPAASRQPSPKPEVPYWYIPCGSNDDISVVDPRNIDEEIRSSLKSLRIQHELMMNDYLSRDYEFLYERVRIGVHEHQYIPNWLPGKKDAHLVKKLKNLTPQMVSYGF